MITTHKELLQPEENNKIFYQWPHYDEYDTYDVGFYYILLMGISLISATSLYFAKFNIKRIIQELTRKYYFSSNAMHIKEFCIY
jgi:hypothetical protein